MARIVCISDTHCGLHKLALPEGDLLLHAGDLTFTGSFKEMAKELRTLGEIRKKFKYGVALCLGNHDWLGDPSDEAIKSRRSNPDLMKMLANENNLIWLQQESVELAGLKIFGSAYTPEFNNWAFNLSRMGELADAWSKIPNDIDIILTHGPPLGYGDSVRRYVEKEEFGGSIVHVPATKEPLYEHVGCYDLMERIKSIKSVKYSIFGHVHSGHGIYSSKDPSLKTKFINAAICDEKYIHSNQAVVIDTVTGEVREEPPMDTAALGKAWSNE